MVAKTKPAADLAYLCRALKAPSLARSVERLPGRRLKPLGVPGRLLGAGGGGTPGQRR